VYNLSLHIEYLLLRHDCVVVPGLGAFINVRHAAQLDSEQKVWMPMTREVRFNSALCHDDGLLANSYARKNSATFQNGREMLRRDIDQLREALEIDGEITLGNLGILRLDNGSTAFIPQQTSAQISGILGYMPVPTYVLKQDCTPTITTEEKTESDTETTTDHRQTSDEETTPSKKRKKRVFDTERNYYIAVNKIFARTAAIFLLITAVSLSLLPTQEKPHVDKASVVPAEKIIKNTAACLYPSETNEASETKVTTAETTDTVSDEAVHYRYHVVVATFRSPSEADEFIRQNEGTGYTLHTVNTKTMSRVSAISSDDRAELQSQMMSPEFRMRFGEAWIWEDPTR